MSLFKRRDDIIFFQAIFKTIFAFGVQLRSHAQRFQSQRLFRLSTKERR